MWVRNGRALAPPWMVCRIGRLDLEEAAVVQSVRGPPGSPRDRVDQLAAGPTG